MLQWDSSALIYFNMDLKLCSLEMLVAWFGRINDFGG